MSVPGWEIREGDVLDRLREMPDESVHCVVTSPPYFGLRDYGTAAWDGGDPECGHQLDTKHQIKGSTSAVGRADFDHQRNENFRSVCGRCGARRVDQQLGLEATPDEYIARMVAVFREVRRVMRSDATLFCNMGDGYQDKQLLMMPARLALALQADGWFLRSEIIWHKPHPMPESVQGSHFYRHRVTIDEYERLSRLWAAEGGDEDRASDLPGLSAREVSDGEAAVSAEREGPGNGASARGAARCDGEAPPVLGVGAGEGEQRQVSPDTEGRGGWAEARGELQGTAADGRGDRYSGGLVADSGAARLPLLLLPEEADEVDARPRDSVEQGRQEFAGERGASLPQLQFEEEGSSDPSLLVNCPGCPKCAAHHGLILYEGAGRPTKAHEQIFLLTKRGTYYFDQDAIREPQTGNAHSRGDGLNPKSAIAPNGSRANDSFHAATVGLEVAGGRNSRSVWTIATQPYSEAHFATFPEELPRRCILAGTSERGVCPACGAPWRRVVERTNPRLEDDAYVERAATPKMMLGTDRNDYGASATGLAKPGWRELPPATNTTTGWEPTCAHGKHDDERMQATRLSAHRNAARSAGAVHGQEFAPKVTTGWDPECSHALDPVPATVLDPFAGSGTTLMVAVRHGRSALGIELNPEYAAMARRRILADHGAVEPTNGSTPAEGVQGRMAL